MVWHFPSVISLPRESGVKLAYLRPIFAHRRSSAESEQDMPQIARFEVLREMGQGLCGTVYKAVDPATQKLVAIRKMSYEQLLAGPREQQRQVLAAMRQAMTLDSPNIARTFELGEEESGIYLVSEYLEGITLHALCEKGTAFSNWDLIDTTRQVCSALDHAHARGLTHRNLHPGNILREWDGNIKVMDYGLPVDPLGRFEPETLVRAIYYLSPEQAKGESLDRRSNLFSWGAVLYQMATGERPFDGVDRSAILQNVLNCDPKPPKIQSQFATSPAMILMKALAKAPGKRYQTGEDLVRELEACSQPNNAPAVPAAAKADRSPASPRPNLLPRREPPAKMHVPQPPPAISRPMPTPTPVSSQIPPAPGRPVIVANNTPSGASPARVLPRVTAGSAQVALDSTTAPLPKASADFIVVNSRAPVASPAPPVPKMPKTVRTVRNDGKRLVSEANALLFQVLASGRRAMTSYGAAVIITFVVLAAVYGIYSRLTKERHQEAQVQTNASLPAIIPVGPPSQVEMQAQTPVMEEPNPASGKKLRKKRVVSVAAPLPVLTAELVVESSPAGAQIQVDGRSTGSVTPSALTQLSAGEHAITLSKDGYAAEHRTVQLRAAQRVALAVTLSELQATVSISSQPEGASVLIDGKDTGKVTPLTIAVHRGNHSITLTRNGFFPDTRTFDAQPGKSYELPFRLTAQGRSEEIKDVGKLNKLLGGGAPQSMGKVKIKTNPKGAQIAVNGRQMDKLTPAEYFFPAGIYEVTLAAEGYKPTRKTINVSAGAKLLVEERLDKATP